MTDILNLRSPEWMNNPSRNCAIPDEFEAKEVGAISDEWFPTELGEVRYAKRLCAGCPVQMQCFEYAFERPELEGIWGGTATGQRNRLRTRRKAQAKKAGNDAA